MAGLFNSLMTGVLGYDSYLAQGGDWGGAISSFLGLDHVLACRGIHINIMTMRHCEGPKGPEEEAWALRCEREQEMENGYRTQQGTRPQTLSYAMMDSPVGVARLDCREVPFLVGHRGRRPRERARTGHSARQHSWSTSSPGPSTPRPGSTMDAARRVIACFRRRAGGSRFRPRRPCSRPSFSPGRPVPTSKRMYNITRWTEMPRGGHFAALEQPDLLIEGHSSLRAPLAPGGFGKPARRYNHAGRTDTD